MVSLPTYLLTLTYIVSLANILYDVENMKTIVQQISIQSVQ